MGTEGEGRHLVATHIDEPRKRNQSSAESVRHHHASAQKQTDGQRTTRVPAVDEEGRIQADDIVVLFLLPLPRAAGFRHRSPRSSPPPPSLQLNWRKQRER